jgi:hypothetical protein
MAKKTYADIAQQIINKYSKRGDSDTWANTAKEFQLKGLMNKQEAERERMGLVEQPQMKNGGKMKYDGYNNSQYLPDEEVFLNPNDNLTNLFGNSSSTVPDIVNPNQVIPQKTTDTYTPQFTTPTENVSPTSYSPVSKTQMDITRGSGSKFGYLDALSLAPVAYNAIQGMMPEDRLKAGDYQTKKTLTPYELNYAPAKQEALSSNRALNKDILSTGNKSVGDIIRNLRGSRQGYMNQVSDITSKEQMGNAALKMQADQGNIAIDQSNKSIAFSVDDWNAKSKAARINMLGEAATQLAQFAQGKKGDKVTINAINYMLQNYTFDANGNLTYKSTGKPVPADEAREVKKVMINKV